MLGKNYNDALGNSDALIKIDFINEESGEIIISTNNQEEIEIDFQ